MAQVTVYTDGGARGNPGAAAIGVVVERPCRSTLKKERFIGHATNNQAEYRALLWACHMLEGELPANTAVEFKLDSELVVKQLNGEYKIKDADLTILKDEVERALKRLAVQATFTHIPRSQNKEADRLVNHALDRHARTAHR